MAEPNANASGTPASLGPWTIQSQVGAGGMGVVYRATRDDRVAALKVIRPGLLDDQAVQARFAREVEVLRRVRDVHISEFLDADLTSEPAWLATAFIDGPNLRDFVGQRGPLPTSVWWDLARGLSQALAVLEVHGITHRDLKPANVILADHGPVLIDFGIAVPEDAASLTGTGLVTGSPSWLSPEQANLQPISTASDVFSLGSLLAFAGTGRPPFGQGAHVAVLLAIASRDPDIVGLDEAQQRLLRHMMAKNPAERPTARQVLAWTKRGPSGIPPLPEAFGAGEATTVMTGAAAATQVLQPPAVGPLTAPQAGAPGHDGGPADGAGVGGRSACSAAVRGPAERTAAQRPEGVHRDRGGAGSRSGCRAVVQPRLRRDRGRQRPAGDDGSHPGPDPVRPRRRSGRTIR